MLQLSCEIEIEGEKFDYVGEVQILSSWKTLTDTATIKVPRNLISRNKMKLNDKVAVGHKVSIRLGYNLEPSLRFKGYVDAIGAATNEMEIKCQDDMWLLKKGSYTCSWKNASIDDVVGFIKDSYQLKFEHETLGDFVSLGQWKVEGLSGAKILQKLKDDFGIGSFFRNGILVLGKPYETKVDAKKEISFAYGQNVITWKDLTYRDKKDIKLKTRLINMKPNGTKEESIKGDDDGEERTLHFYNLSKTDLDKQADALIERMKYSGYRGKLTAFGIPAVAHGNVAVIKDYRMPDREGKYFIDSVETTFSNGGMRQVFELGPVAAYNT